MLMEKKALLVVAPLLALALAGCVQPPGPPEGGLLWHGFEWAAVPSQCEASMSDACSLYGCMVESCWCAETAPSAIVAEWNHPVSDENAAMAAVNENLDAVSGRLWPDASSEVVVKRAVKLNAIFFNVFLDYGGDEGVVTVAADGTIFLSQCGV
ncbi:hypothetical protein COY71_00845 [Candidatus Micrarchaeota archaeon CG_4_10_14_0_8_um_filter_60_7]|nr:MAG: hypothetical protein COY71_00845 [Candidatus Micrarchaeota archaeon CG_4_10_14_0_8_um_filter_60_7]